MKVTIDTKEDSYEDLHKVLQILSHILQQKGLETKSSSESVDTTSMMSMFDENKETADTPPDFSSFLKLTEGKTTTPKAERPRIEIF
ncbi:TPA: hypothetical protein HA242_04350 [Candidatus Woesearchaeota archaeon]|nr:hypothetical protein [Candidatus Woesearchaeota archaeon]HIH12930.1 hypothetical protein [Candidatus Woesearchaeota archaeon]